jgi:preprotein translocase subunit SecG
MMLLAAWYHLLFATVFAMFGVMLMIVILLQRGRGTGLSGAFGGAGGANIMGSKTGDILTKITMVGIAVFLLMAAVLNYVFRPSQPAGPVQPSVGQQNPAAPGGTTGAGDEGQSSLMGTERNLPAYANWLHFVEDQRTT